MCTIQRAHERLLRARFRARVPQSAREPASGRLGAFPGANRAHGPARGRGGVDIHPRVCVHASSWA
eukprot:5426803-Prymnesium_polylepis.3